MSELIQNTPGVLGGDARIANRRIAVWMLVLDRRGGLSDQETCESYAPPLTQEELDGAWKYGAEHRDEIDAAIRDHEEG